MLGALGACLELHLSLMMLVAHGIAAAEITEELAYLFGPDPMADRIGTSGGPDLSRAAGLAQRFSDDLADDIERRVLTAELMTEDRRRAAASFTEDTIVGRSLARGFVGRLSTIAGTEWSLAANEARSTAMARASRLRPDVWVKFLYFDERPCDGSCIVLACGGLDGRGVYSVANAPMPVRDTHPNCRCLLVPSPPPFTASAWAPASDRQDPNQGVEYLKSVGQGFLDTVNPLEMWRGVTAAIHHLHTSQSKSSALAELGVGTLKGPWQTIRDAVSYKDPHTTGYAQGSLLPDILLSLIPGIGQARAAAKGMQLSGRAASTGRKVAGATRTARKTARAAEAGAAARRKLTPAKRAVLGETRLAEHLEQTGRKFILDPRKRSVYAHGPDAVTYRWEGPTCQIEFWDNKAWAQSRTVSTSSALDRLGSRGAALEFVENTLSRAGLLAAEVERIRAAINAGRVATRRVVTNAAGRARGGAALNRRGIEFEQILDDILMEDW